VPYPQTVKLAVQRLHVYLARIERDLDAGDRPQALANLAELGEIARRLWHSLQPPPEP